MISLIKPIILLMIMIPSRFIINTNSAQTYKSSNHSKEQPSFEWPEGKKMGLCLTFDDSRLTKVDKDIALLDKYEETGTLYVSPNLVSQHVPEWKKAILNGHDIASHIKGKSEEMPHTQTPVYKNPLYPNEQRIEDLLSRMTLKEKVGQMNIPCVYKKRIGWGLEVGEISIHKHMTLKERQTQMEGCRKFARGDHNDQIGPGGGFFTLADRIIYEGTRKQAEFFNELQEIAINESRLGIPVLQIEEGTHGFMCAGGTIFPEGLAMGSTWNMDLIKRIYQVIAKEGRSTGAHVLCTVVIEPNRDPRLGRNQEGYSEDPYMCSRIAENIVTAMQGYDVSGNDKVIAALSHYPGQSEPLNGLERGAMEISERKLRNVFLPPWEAGINKCGALAVMATYPELMALLYTVLKSY